MTIAWEEFRVESIRELLPLLRENWAELETHRFDLDPDFETYLRVAQMGGLRYLTAREDGLLVGYAILMVTHSLYYAGVPMGVVNVIWLHPSYRAGALGLRLLQAIVDGARASGVRQLHVSEKVTFERDRGGLGKILGWLGFTEVERVHELIL